MNAMRPAILLIVVALSAAGCATRKAHAIEDTPTLAVPPVPPRTIEPQPVEEPPRIEPIAEPNTVAAPPPARAPKPRPSEPRPAEAKPDPPETAGATPPPPPVAPLRTPTSPTGADAARQVRDTITRAESLLKQVDYQKLSNDRRVTYDSAKNFIQQSEEKLKQEDFQLALSFATRAETIAQTLQNGSR
jgi:hypothetical protein